MKSFLLFFLILAMPFLEARDGKPLTVQDIMRFRSIQDIQVSDNGTWIVFSSVPDRGDPEGVARATGSDAAWRIPLGSNPAISNSGEWAAFTIVPPALEVEKAAGNKKKKEKLKNGMVLLKTASGEQVSMERVTSFAFSDDNQWLARLHMEDEKKKDDENKLEPEAEPSEKAEEKQEEKAETAVEKSEEKAENAEEKSEEKAEKKKPKKDKTLGTRLVLRRLADASEIEIQDVTDYRFDPKGRFLVYGVSASEGKGNGVYYRDLKGDLDTAHPLHAEDNTLFPKMEWHEKGSAFAFISRVKPEKEKEKGYHQPDGTLFVWDAKNAPFKVEDIPQGMAVSQKGTLTWTQDGERLFFGLAPVRETEPEKGEDDEDKEEEIDLFDIEKLRSKTGLDVWHGNDPRIKTHEKTNWKREQNRTLTAVFHVDKKRTVQLARGQQMVRPTENESVALMMDREPYLRESTWTGGAMDLYAVGLKDGKTTSIMKKANGSTDMSLSPGGRFLTYYLDGHHWLLDLKTNKKRNLTSSLDVSFADERHDYPSAVPGYGYAGWLENDKAIMIRDRYDIWLFPTNDDKPAVMTRGRAEQITFRIVKTDPDSLFYKKGETVLLTAMNHVNKTQVFHEMEIGGSQTRALTHGVKFFRFVARAKDADLVLFTREDFSEYPDLRAADMHLKNVRRLTDENPQAAEFGWGEPMLVSWRSSDGKPLEGALYKPANYEEGKQYPVLVYYYRYFSQRLNTFNEMVVNHRPNFPFYTSNGYAVFLPDIKFEVGYPGHTAVQALVPGIQKIVDMGIANPDAIGLHGHSWSGYQTAFAVTQTDIFTCAISGAPVSNMTSAYSGIRLGSGLARQFQYETGQSRIGANMWERRDLYIDNSPVFFADRINTPMMIMFGDKDNAVPWDQGVEMYMAMRRMDKDVIFLQYRDEPHHLKKYPNKVDYTLKMKEYLDHYLKGEPAPKWLSEGVPYLGE